MTQAFFEVCPKCKGKKGKTKKISCENCKGKGKIKRNKGEIICFPCKGSGKISIYISCNRCHGFGIICEFF